MQFPVEAVPQTFLAIPDQTDVGLSDTLPAGLCFFIPRLLLLACLAVWACHDHVAQALSVPMFCIQYRKI